MSRIAFALALSLALPFCLSATAGSQDAVAKCTALARMPDRVGAGVRYDQLQPELAVPSCREALRLSPSDGDVQANLARALTRQIDLQGSAEAEARSLESERDQLLFTSYMAKSPQGIYLFLFYQANTDGNLPNSMIRAVAPPTPHPEYLSALQQSADAGYLPAEYLLGWCLVKGMWGPPDAVAGFQLIRRSVEEGSDLGQLDLGLLYLAGLGTTSDLRSAEHWLSRAADAGDPRAALLAAWQLERHGETARARTLYERAVGQGYSVASVLLPAVAPADRVAEPAGSALRDGVAGVFDLLIQEGKRGHLMDEGAGELGGFGVSLLESTFGQSQVDAEGAGRRLAVAAASTGLNSEDSAFWMARLSEALLREGRGRDALQLAAYCNELRKQFVYRKMMADSDPRLVESYELLAQAYVSGDGRNKDQVRASMAFEAAWRLREREPQLQTTAMVDDELWLSHYWMFVLNEPAKSAQVLSDAVSLSTRLLGADDSLTWRATRQLAEAKYAVGDLDEAVTLSESFLKAGAAKTGGTPESWRDYERIGLIRESQGAWDKAEQAIRHAYDIAAANRGPRDPKTVALGNQLIFVMWSAGSRQDALSFAGRLLKMEQSDGPPIPRLSVNRTRTLLADDLVALGRFSEAEVLLRQYQQDVQQHPPLMAAERVDAISNLGYILELEGRFEDAEPWRQRLVTECPSPMSICKYNPEVYLIRNAYAQGRLEEAKARLVALRPKMADVLRNDPPMDLEEATTVYLLARVEWSLDETAWATHDFRASCSALRRFALDDNRVFELKDYRLQCPIQFSLVLGRIAGRTRRKVVDLDEAFALAQQGIVSQAAAALSISAARKIAGKDGAADLAEEYEKALLAARIVGRSGPQDDKDDVVDEFRRRLFTVDRLRGLASRLREKSPRYAEYRFPSPLSLAELQAGDESHPPLLHTGEALALIVPPSGHDPGLVFVVSRAGAALAPIIMSEDELAQLVSCLRQGLDSQSYPIEGNSSLPANCTNRFDRDAAYRLYRSLFGDPAVQKVLRGTTTWMIATTGVLASAPFNALVTSPAGSVADDPASLRKTAWLVRDVAITLLPDASSLRWTRRGKSTRKASAQALVAFADPIFKPTVAWPVDDELGAVPAQRPGKLLPSKLADLPRLPGTRLEAEGLVKWMHGGRSLAFMDADATKSRLFQLDLDGTLGHANVIELATHGAYAGQIWGEPEAALIMAGGRDLEDQIITGSDAATLHLSADWVILSACNTASFEAGDGDGLSGLTRGFIAAGARSLLVSQWSLDDAGTAALVPRILHNAYGSIATTKANAVRKAILSILDDSSIPSGSSPSVWAPFVLIGDPD